MVSIANQSVHAGHTINIKIRGQIVGRIQSGEGNRDFGQEAVYEIGSIMPVEHIPLRYSGGFTVQSYYIRKRALDAFADLPSNEDILTSDIIDIEVIDNVTGETIRVYEGCSLQSSSESFQAGALSGRNASWVYLRSR